MLVSVHMNALVAGTCMILKDSCLIAGDKSTGCIPGQFCRDAIQRRELVGFAHRSQAMTIWMHTCRTAAVVLSQMNVTMHWSCLEQGILGCRVM